MGIWAKMVRFRTSSVRRGGDASDRFGMFLYRLKKPETVIAQTLTSTSQGQGIRATALSLGVNKNTVQAW